MPMNEDGGLRMDARSVLISASESAVQATLNSLTEAELAVARSTEPEALVDLDEDALLDLRGRVRRARNKYPRQYRRHAAGRVGDAGGRGKAYA